CVTFLNFVNILAIVYYVDTTVKLYNVKNN
ncbi:unnamed protein product, partial [marine sediment metagenome]